MLTSRQLRDICGQLESRHGGVFRTWLDTEYIAHEYAHILAFDDQTPLDEYGTNTTKELGLFVGDLVYQLDSPEDRDNNEIQANTIVHVAYRDWMPKYDIDGLDIIVRAAEGNVTATPKEYVRSMILSNSTDDVIIHKAIRLREILTMNILS